MAADDSIKYSDIVSPDDSITKLISQLEELTKQYDTMINAVRASAKEIVTGIKMASGATKEGRAAIDESVAATSRLERAQKELKFSLSDIGKEVAWLKQQTKDTNNATVAQQKAIRALSTSYDKLKLELADNIKLWKSMSEAERQDAAYGGEILQNIHNIQAQVKALDSELKMHVTSLTEVQKAEQRLAYLRSSEGQRLLAIKKEINEITAASRGEKASVDELTRAREKLNRVMSAEYAELQNVIRQTNEQARIAKLQVQLNNSAVGSYNQLAAQYELNKIKLNAMSQEERAAVDIGQKLENETKRIYQQMIILQETTGNHRLSVGNYAKAWNGLGNAMNQIVREIPAMTMGINMFFLAISNNVPILIDEIQRIKRQNELLRAEGRPTQNIMKTITKSIFGWQTALIILITVLSKFGKEIFSFIGNLFAAKKTVMSFNDAINNINDSLKENASELAKDLAAYRKLQRAWKGLKTEAEKNVWLKKLRSEYEKLGLAINSINDAERLFVDESNKVIAAFRARAAATAADKLAAQKYEELQKKQLEAEELTKGHKLYVINYKTGEEEQLTALEYAMRDLNGELSTNKDIFVSMSSDLIGGFNFSKLQNIVKDMKMLLKEADQYYEIADKFSDEAKGILGDTDTHDKNKTPRDLTDTIMRNQIKIQKMHRKALTDFIQDDFSTRKQAADDAYDNEIDKIDELIRKNDEYVANTEGKYKELTDAQKQQIAEQNKLLENTKVYIGWTRDAAKAQIDFEENIRSIQLKRNLGGTGSRFDYIPSEGQQQHVIKKDGTIDSGTQLLTSIEEEKQAWLDYLEWQQSIAIEANGLLTENQREQAEIVTEFEIKKRDIIAKYENIINELRQKDNEDRLQLVKKGTEEELNLLLEQNELARKAAIQENEVLPPEQQRSFQSIKDVYDKQANLIRGQFQINKLEQQQALDKAIFNEIKHNETEITKFTLEQEKTRLEKQIALAEAGMLDWSQVQIDEAKSTVKSINRELSELNSFVANIGKKGLGGTLLEKLGFDDEQIEAFTEAVNIIIEQLQSIADAEVELAEKAVEAAEAKVEAAQKAYDAEIEARNNGYAHNVATAKKELEQERKNQQQKQKILEAAQKRQESLNNITQASSLITASANLWNAFSSIPFIGPALAIAAIATMWTSFAAAKIKAKQVTNQSEEYGEGGLEFLEGGSHASGNDIDLHTKNKRKKNMRAEGGEALAIINKKQTRRYRKALPGIIDSLNRGTFEDKYLNAFNKTDGISFMLQHKENNIDLSKLEKEVSDIRKQSETKYYTLPNGNIVIISRNVKRIIKH